MFVNVAEAVANDQRQAASNEALRDMVSKGQPIVEAKVVSTVLTNICAV
jgi:hypothetical protein